MSESDRLRSPNSLTGEKEASMVKAISITSEYLSNEITYLVFIVLIFCDGSMSVLIPTQKVPILYLDECTAITLQ